MNKLLKSLQSNKLFSLQTVENGTKNDVLTYNDSGSYTLNLALSGDMFKGYPGNKITCLAGESSTGKTFYVLTAAREFLKNNKNGMVIYYDTESATDSDQIKKLGIDASRFQYQSVRFIEELSQMLLIIAKEQMELSQADREPIMVIIDSLGNLASSKEVKDMIEGNDKTDMTKAKKLKAMFRACTIPLSEAGICTLFTNHIYQTQDLFSKQVMSGGCLTEDSKILMSDGSLNNINNIEVGDIVATCIGNKEVLNTFEFNNKELLELEFEDGYIVKCTPEHRFRVNNKWITAKEIFEAVEAGLDINSYIFNNILDDYTEIQKQQIHKMV